MWRHLLGVSVGVSKVAVMSRGLRGGGSIWRRKSDGLWIGAVDVGYRNGKRQRKRVFAKTKAECFRKIEDAKAAIHAGDLSTSSMRVDAWLRYWLDEIVAPDAKPSTLAGYRSIVETALIPTIGDHRLDRLTPIHVREMHKELLRRKPKPLSARSVVHAHWTLSRALKDAQTNVGLMRNVTESVRPPKAADAKTRSLTPEEVRRVLDEAGEDRARWMFALYTGARQGECLGLRWENVDLDDASADLAWSLQIVTYSHGCQRVKDGWECKRRSNYCPKKRLLLPDGIPSVHLQGQHYLLPPKTVRSTRIVDLVPGLVHALRELQQRDGVNPHGLIWHREDGKPVDDRADYKAWRDLLKKAGVEPLPLHTARHTANTLMMIQGVPEAVRMQVLGHSVAATNRLYAHADRTLTRAAVLAIESAVEDQRGG